MFYRKSYFLDPERNAGNSKFYTGDTKKDHTLEDYFFDLERQMENNLVCRDCVCRNIDNEKGNTPHFLFQRLIGNDSRIFVRNRGDFIVHTPTR